MADQLNLIRANAQEKLRKEAEVVVEVEKPSALQTAAVEYLSRKDEPHPLSQNKNLTEGKLNFLQTYIKQGKTAEEISELMLIDPKNIQKLMDAYDAKNESLNLDELNYPYMFDVEYKKPGTGMTAKLKVNARDEKHVKDILKQKHKVRPDQITKMQKEGLNENVNSDIKKILDKEKISYKIQTSKHPLGQKGIITGVFVQAKDEKKASIALGKISPYPHTITTHAEEVNLDEKKSVRQLINPTKEVMIVKKNKVIVIDKKDQDKYMKQGWTLAEETKLEEARWKVKIEGLPPIYMDSSSAGEVKAQLRKLIKKPDMIQDIERVTDAEVNKALRNKISGKEVEEAKLREEVGLDEKIKIEFKTDPKNSNKTMIMKKGKHQGDIIKTNKGYQVMQFNKPAGKIFKSLDDIKPAVRKLYGEAKLIDKPTGEVLKTGSKEKMETEKKRNRDELQVKEWFKLKNIDVKVRELDESTQVYVPLGRRIPNEIREELIKTQYGKMPEDVKNVKDINYGNFMENSITMNNDFWTKVLHDTKGE